jgi:hypothetical protein
MRTNVLTETAPVYTHEGAKGKTFSPFRELERAVVTCLLGEDSFYESGEDIMSRISSLIPKCDPLHVSTLAIRAREEFQLRHVPLFLARELARKNGNGKYVEPLLYSMIQRPDELGEYVSLFWKDKKQPLSAASKRGLAAAFVKFNEYQLAKWDRNNDAIKLRDVIRLVHPKPISDEQSAVWRALIAGTLATPDTWETELSAGKDKKETFTRLILERKLGGLALLRNLRNCIQSGVDSEVLRSAINEHPFSRVLPFRFLAAAKHAPALEPEIDKAMQRAAAGQEKLLGKTAILVDISRSMREKISAKSDLQRTDAAAGIAIVASYLAEQYCVGVFANSFVGLPPRSGMALRDAIANASGAGGGTSLGSSLRQAYNLPTGFVDADRVIVVTDEQSSDSISITGGQHQFRYIINVAPYKNGVADAGGWHRISGFSEAVFSYIKAHESLDLE